MSTKSWKIERGNLKIKEVQHDNDLMSPITDKDAVVGQEESLSRDGSNFDSDDMLFPSSPLGEEQPKLDKTKKLKNLNKNFEQSKSKIDNNRT